MQSNEVEGLSLALHACVGPELVQLGDFPVLKYTNETQ
jgi:hypothetical protein